MKTLPLAQLSILITALIFSACGKTELETEEVKNSPDLPPAEMQEGKASPTEKAASSDQPGTSEPSTPEPSTPEPSTPEPNVPQSNISRDDGPTPQPDGVRNDSDPWQNLSEAQKLEILNSKEIALMPKHVFAEILSATSSLNSPEAQFGRIKTESAAWYKINQFQSNSRELPEPHKDAIVNLLAKQHPDSWQPRASELKTHLAAADQVMKWRLNGMPGLSAAESEEIIMDAMVTHFGNFEKVKAVVQSKAKLAAGAN